MVAKPPVALPSTAVIYWRCRTTNIGSFCAGGSAILRGRRMPPTATIASSDRQVFGAHLNCSESARMPAVSEEVAALRRRQIPPLPRLLALSLDCLATAPGCPYWATGTDAACRPNQRRGVRLRPKIGIGGSLAAPPLPHHTPPYVRVRIRRFKKLR
jgi:hypothetical protein